MPISFFTSKKTLKCAWKHQLCLSPRFAEGEQIRKEKAHLGPQSPVGKVSRRWPNTSFPQSYADCAKRYPAPAAQTFWQQEWKLLLLASYMGVSRACEPEVPEVPKTAVVVLSTWCFYKLVQCRRLSWTSLTWYDLRNCPLCTYTDSS